MDYLQDSSFLNSVILIVVLASNAKCELLAV
jgi:hypothetical protein